MSSQSIIVPGPLKLYHPSHFCFHLIECLVTDQPVLSINTYEQGESDQQGGAKLPHELGPQPLVVQRHQLYHTCADTGCEGPTPVCGDIFFNSVIVEWCSSIFESCDLTIIFSILIFSERFPFIFEVQ